LLENPEPFCLLARELYPGNYAPTPAHCFVRLLHEKGVLLRNYTQNIDTLEREAGIPGEKLVEAHGSFAQAHCLECRKAHTREQVKEEIFAERVPRCTAVGCNGLVKPDIVFFGEALPERFHQVRPRVCGVRETASPYVACSAGCA
jgi:NAD-dependent protein deacetylase sirtuin 2